MDEDEEMWFNDDEDDFESQSDATSTSADASKIKSCFVSLKACPAQGDGDSDAKTSPKAGKDGEHSPSEKKKGHSASKGATNQAKPVRKSTTNLINNHLKVFFAVKIDLQLSEYSGDLNSELDGYSDHHLVYGPVFRTPFEYRSAWHGASE